jgi:hypothetical protein
VKVREENDALLGRLRAVRQDLQHVQGMFPSGEEKKVRRTDSGRKSDIQRTIERLRSLEEIVEMQHVPPGATPADAEED